MPRKGDKQPTIVRYESKVDRSNPDGCHPWTAGRDKNGYGLFWNGEVTERGPVTVRAHRWGYGYYVGPIPAGLWVLHRCDNPPCQNRSHWFLGTNAENSADRDTKGRTVAFFRGKYGADHPNSTLSQEDVDEIRKRYVPNPNYNPKPSGPSQSVLAKEYGVSRECISKIVRGVRWT